LFFACRADLVEEVDVVEVGAEPGELVEIGDPLVADPLRDRLREDGFELRSQRRGVTPFVLLLKRSGQRSWKS